MFNSIFKSDSEDVLRAFGSQSAADVGALEALEAAMLARKLYLESMKSNTTKRQILGDWNNDGWEDVGDEDSWEMVDETKAKLLEADDEWTMVEG
jgi:hypothetical protein